MTFFGTNVDSHAIYQSSLIESEHLFTVYESCSGMQQEEFISPAFGGRSEDGNRWALTVFPEYIDEHGDEWLSVSLRLLASEEASVAAKFEISIVDWRQQVVQRFSGQQTFSMGSGWCSEKFVRHDYPFTKVFGYSPSLHVVCRLSVVARTETMENLLRLGSRLPLWSGHADSHQQAGTTVPAVSGGASRFSLGR